MVPIAGEGTSSSSAVPKIRSSRVPSAVIRVGSWVREPAWSIAAVREVEEPTVKAPVTPAPRFATPKAKRSRLGRVG